LDPLAMSAAKYVARKFLEKEGVDLSLDKMAFGLILETCEGVLAALKKDGRANVVLPCIFKKDGRQLHLDVMVFMDEISCPGGDSAGR
jgi:hypothetical protein